MNILDIIFASKLGKKGYLKLNNNTDRLLARRLYNKSSGQVEITTDTEPYLYREVPVQNAFKAKMHKIVGASVVWNQMWEKPSVNQPSKNACTITVENEEITITPNSYTSNSGGIYRNNMIYGHKVLLIADLYADGESSLQVEFGRASQRWITIPSKTWTKLSSVTYNSTLQTGTNSCNIYMRCNASGWESGTLKVKNVIEVDLTAMFGTTIADYVYTLETSQSGSGIAWLQSYGFFTKDYYAYKQNKLESGCVSAHKTYDGETLLTNTELSPITLRGLFKLSTDKLTVDGDEYNADGSVKRKYATITLNGTQPLRSVNWRPTENGVGVLYYYDTTNNKIIENNVLPNAISDKLQSQTYYDVYSSGKVGFCFYNTTAIGLILYFPDTSLTTESAVNTYLSNNPITITYEVATPTTEQTTPFTETEIVGSTEEFIDNEVAQGNRDVAIPVGHETDYYVKIRN